MMEGGSRDVGRGQTLPDFVVGMAIFLLTVTLIVQFVPQLVLPHQEQERPVVVQRAANDLGSDLLAGETTRSELDATCTRAFFNQTDVAGCPFDTDDALTAQVGIDRRYELNVTLRTAPSDDPDSALLCDDGNVGACGTNELALGPSIPETDESVAIARRRVFVGDTEAVIEVGVW